MFNKVFQIILLLSLLSFGCKKESNSNTSTSTSGTPIPPNNYPNNADIICNIGVGKTRVSGYEAASISALAYFLPQTGQLNPLLTVDSFFVNGDRFKVNSSTAYYMDTLITPPPPSQWNFSVYSQTRFANLQFTMSKAPANLSAVNLVLSDTIHKSGFTFSHPLIQADSFYYKIEDASIHMALKKVTGNSTGIHFSSSDMALLSTCTSGAVFTIEAYNYSRMYAGNNIVYFQNLSVARNFMTGIKN